MKTILILISLISSISKAGGIREQLEQAVRDTMHKEVCAPSQSVAYAYNYRIIKKIDNHHYEMTGLSDGEIELHAVLVTTKTQFETTGVPRGINMEYSHTIEAEMNSGFKKKVDVWFECEKK